MDPNSGLVSSIQLPVGRGKISVTVVGSKILFAGGDLNAFSLNYYQKVDIYDLETNIMQSVDFSSEMGEIKSVVVESRVFYSSRSTVFIVDTSTNGVETITAPLSISAAAASGDRIFFLNAGGRRAIINILNVQNMTSSATPTEFAYDDIVLGLVYFRTSLALVSYTSILNIDVDNPSRQVFRTTFSERNLAAYTLIGEELYLIGPGFITIYRPYARLLRFRSSILFHLGAQSTELNGIIYCSGGFNGGFRDILKVDTRALFHTIQLSNEFNQRLQLFYTAGEYLFAFEGALGKIFYYNLRTGEEFEEKFTTTFIIGQNNIAKAGNRLVVVTQSTEYFLFDTIGGTWSVRPRPAIRSTSVPIANDDYVVLRNGTMMFVLKVATNEWVALDAKQYYKVYIVEHNIVLIEDYVLKIYNMITRQWTTGFQLDAYLRLGSVAVHNSTIFIAGVGDGEEQRKVHMYSIETGQYRVEYLSAARCEISTLVYEEWVIFTGGRVRSGTFDFSGRVDIYNVNTNSWQSTTLPPNLSFHARALISMGARDKELFIARENRVDKIDLNTGAIKAILIPQLDPESVTVFGSKVVFFSTRFNNRQVGIYETTTDTSFSYAYDGANADFSMTENYIVARVFSGGLKLLELPTILTELNDAQLFVGEDLALSIEARGRLLGVQWQHNTTPLYNETNLSLTLSRVTQASSGTYSIQIYDQCNQRMTQQASLVVHGPPIIIEPLEGSVVMCHELAPISITVSGEQMTFNWTFVGTSQVTSVPSVVLYGESFECNSSHQLCVVASNPSGSTQSCNHVRVVDHNSVFDGPRPTSAQLVWLSESEVMLTVRLVDKECKQHEWLMNGAPMNVSGTDASSVRVFIEPLIATASFTVVTWCGSSRLESHPFKFSNISSWTVAAVVSVVVGGSIGIIALVVVAYVVRRRIVAGQTHELELENLLTQAKSESLKLNSGEINIVRSTTWEWTPAEGFTYNPIDKMPFAVDYSSLSALAKDSVKVGVWNQSIIEFSLRRTKVSASKRGMKERLIDGTHIDIYAPCSPKYEIKIEPSSIDLDSNSVTHVTVSSTMRMTAKCKICLIVVDERDKIYSVIEFKVSSGMSTWIDLEEVESNGEYLGGGGYVI